jgi:hypothetical protein
MSENWWTSVSTRLRGVASRGRSASLAKPEVDGVRTGFGRPRTVLAREEGLALEHLAQDAAHGPIRRQSESSAQSIPRARQLPPHGRDAPHVDRLVVLLPREHDLGRPVVARRDVARHLRVLEPGEPKVAELEVAVFVDENVGRLEVAVDDAGRVDVFQAAEHLVEKVLRGPSEEKGGVTCQ